MYGYVIMQNDSPKKIVLGDADEARRVSEEMASEHYSLTQWQYHDYLVYRSEVHWHVRMVPFIDVREKEDNVQSG